MTEFWKGYQNISGRSNVRTYYKVEHAGDNVSITAFKIESAENHEYSSFEDVENDGHQLMRRISEEEFNLYRDISHLIGEFYLHDMVGGFPGFTTMKIVDDIKKDAKKTMVQFYCLT